jgi:hypothetical protein
MDTKLSIDKKDILDLIEYLNTMYIIENYDDTLDMVHDKKLESEEYFVGDMGFNSCIFSILDYFKDKGIDLYDDVRKMKHLNFTKIADRAEDYHRFKDLAWEEFYWLDEDAPENFTIPWIDEKE